MAAESSPGGPPWAWLFAGLLIGGAAVALTLTMRSSPPQEAPDKQASVDRQLHKLTQRLEQLESQRAQARTPRPDLAPTSPPQERRRLAQDRPDEQAQRVAQDQEPRGTGKTAPTQGAAPRPPVAQVDVVEDGHEYDDGIVVDLNPTAPVAADPIPASAQSSQDNAAVIKEAFPKGCPTCGADDEK